MASLSLLERQSRHQAGPGHQSGLGGLNRASFHRSLSQPAAAADNDTPYQSRTLPRQRHRNNSTPQATKGGVHNLASARRKIVSSAVSDYLKSLNSMTRSIVLEREFVEEKHGGEWTAMDETLREEAVNEHFMPSDVRAHYDDGLRPSPVVAGTAYGRGVRLSSPSRQSEREYREQGEPLEKTPLPRNRGLEIHSNNLTVASSPSYPSQPRPDRDRNNASNSPAYFISPNYNRLHKNQLSYRSKTRKAVSVPPPQNQKRDSGLGSDGESPRTSDEDMHKSLGFHRNHLRSYSFRHRRAGSRNPNSVLRSSTRKTHRTANDDSSRPDHTHVSHPSSEPDYDNGYDAEVDLPDDSLLLDHVPSQQHEPVRTPPKPPRYSSRTRRSLRMQPRVLADEFQRDEEEGENEEVVIIPNLHPRVAAQDSSSSESAGMKNYHSNIPRLTEPPSIVVPNLRRVQSEDSIDTDTDAVSIAPSNLSMLSKSTGVLTEDDVLSDNTRLCTTPDSMLSATSSTTSLLSKPKGIVRSRPQSLRGGSALQTSTSEFANRHAQFKPNMLRKQQSNQNSPSVTREPTPSLSTPVPPESSPQATEDNKYLRQSTLKSPSPSPCKSPSLSLPVSKRLLESIATDFPTSPENLSQLSSPPHTPLVKSVRLGPPSHLQEIQEQRRESGYISSSSESFAFAARR